MTEFACSDFMQWIYSEMDALFFCGLMFIAYLGYKTMTSVKKSGRGHTKTFRVGE